MTEQTMYDTHSSLRKEEGRCAEFYNCAVQHVKEVISSEVRRNVWIIRENKI